MRITRFVPSREKMVVSAMSCPKCGWKKSFMLDLSRRKPVVILGKLNGEDVRSVADLPKKCPLCSARLEKTEFPVPFQRRIVD